MKDYNASSPEVQSFVDSVDQTKAIASIIQVVEKRMQKQLEDNLLDFQQSIAQGNAIAIDLMLEELSKIKEENATVKGALKKLSSAIAPDLPPEEEVVSFRQAIENLEKYGSIIPSTGDVAAKRLQIQQNHAWSLFRQAIAKFLIRKLEKMLENRVPS